MPSTFGSAFATEVVADLLTEFGQSATVSRDSATVTMTVIIDSQEVKARDNRDVMISRNWTVIIARVGDYNLGDGVTKPQSIDEIVIDSRRFEPRTPDGKMQCWEYAEGTSSVLRIYVEEVS